MNLLLDTHVVLWFAMGDERLTRKVEVAISDPSNNVFVSAASAWEISIKYSRGKLGLPMPPDLFLTDVHVRYAFDELPIRTNAAVHLAKLPFHHHDPFDRMLIAQALVEGLTLVTNDPLITRYPVVTLW